MKINEREYRANLVEKELQSLVPRLEKFESNNPEFLCELAASLVMIEEYWLSSDAVPIIRLKFQDEVVNWLSEIYREEVVLVLKFEDKYYGYTRNNICKTLRGKRYHYDEKSGSPKQLALARFSFEDREASVCEFALTRTWLITPGLSYLAGNKDSRNPYLEKLQINNSPVKEITTLESMIVDFIFEFISIADHGFYFNKSRVICSIDKSVIESRFGNDLGNKCWQTIQKEKSLKSNNV